jgi:hypothetical protein
MVASWITSYGCKASPAFKRDPELAAPAWRDSDILRSLTRSCMAKLASFTQMRLGLSQQPKRLAITDDEASRRSPSSGRDEFVCRLHAMIVGFHRNPHGFMEISFFHEPPSHPGPYIRTTRSASKDIFHLGHGWSLLHARLCAWDIRPSGRIKNLAERRAIDMDSRLRIFYLLFGALCESNILCSQLLLKRAYSDS